MDTDINIGATMARQRVAAKEAEFDKLTLEEKKARSKQLLEEAHKNPRATCYMATWFRGKRTIVAV